MLTHPETTSVLGKREHSSDEESSCHNSAAGLRPTTHQNNRRKVDDGQEAMDAEFEAHHPTILPDGLTLNPSIVSDTPEISENVKSLITESPCPSLPLPAPGPDPLRRLDLPVASSSEEVVAVSSSSVQDKIQQEESRISHPNSASELYDRLVLEGHTDPVRAWLEALSLPCHPDRVEIPPKSTTSTKKPTNAGSQPSLPLDPQSDSINATASGEVKDRADKKVKGGYYTACTLDQATLKEYCNWNFLRSEPTQKFENLPKTSTYNEKHQTPKGGERVILRIEDRPIPRQTIPLNWRIVNHLLHEVARMDPTKDDSEARLTIPREWKTEDAAMFPLPLLYSPPTPNPYKGSLPMGQAFFARVATPLALYVVSETGSPPPDDASEPSQEEESEESKIVRTRVEKLCNKKEYNISLIPEENKKERSEVAVKFYEALNLLNLPYNKYHSKRDAVRRVQGIYEPNLCYRWRFRAEIQKQDNDSRTGDTTSQEDTSRIKDYPPFVILQFLNYTGQIIPETPETEMTIEKTVGGLLRCVVTGKDLVVSDNSTLDFPPHLRPVGSSPKPDVCVRASASFGWPASLERLRPVVFAEECKRDATVDPENIRAQLATAFHATLIILILYYLDTRKEVTSDLPPWLFLYGLEYGDFGVNICAHYPSYEFDGDEGHWELHSKIITQEYLNVFLPDSGSLRMRFLSIVYKIRSHSMFVLEQLRTWDRAENVLSILLKSKK